ncbi:hypothetical protein LPJ60_003923 [Coemansia sp. RSA 2675]|uniref:Uncharacterized protein n=1 Tax=Coemansia linderi TaxID=2663919 RepID=A0ACC1KBP2_9FUNG|nr:hypothetical protein LPJ60_003923 [Coemansia sp. RSA 2675]KAJ2782859.1 hypothetical protein GGI18_003575 [Coemansia linderi]
MLSAPDASTAPAYDEAGLAAVTHYVSALSTANVFSPFGLSHSWPSNPRKCIIYLEPRRTSPLYKAIEEFFAQSALHFGPTEAHMYHPHSSMTGFIDLSQTPNPKHLIASIAAHLDRLIPGLPKMPRLTGVGTARDYPHGGTHKIEAKLDTPSVFREIVDLLRELVPVAGIRPKKIGHISLAYFNKHVHTNCRIEDPLAVDMQGLASSLLEPLINSEVDNTWDIAFYELALESTALHIPHQFNEIARWHL